MYPAPMYNPIRETATTTPGQCSRSQLKKKEKRNEKIMDPQMRAEVAFRLESATSILLLWLKASAIFFRLEPRLGRQKRAAFVV